MHEIDLRRIDLNLLVVFETLMAERSVTRAADRLARSQSAISHALARLREQVGDPLLVKSGGTMRPSPQAEAMVGDVRAILAGIRRVLAPPRPFDPAASDRVFRIAIPDLAHSLYAGLADRVLAAAPRCGLEWVARDAHTPLRIAEGQVDVALMPSVVALPDDLATDEIGAFRWATFLRRGHPALRRWDRAAWERWPHAAVRVSLGLESPVAAAAGTTRRRIAVWAPQFSAIAPLLERTDLLATLPRIAMLDALERFRVVARPVPFVLAPMRHRLVWSRRLDADPANAWIRARLREVFDIALARADAIGAGLPPRRRA